MRYVVTGASKETGKEYSESIDAASAAEAEMFASKHGMLVSDVSTMPATRSRNNYGFMFVLARIVTICGVLLMVIGAMTAGIGLFGDSPLGSGMILIVSGLSSCLSGLLSAALGQTIGAVRDIAMNSFSELGAFDGGVDGNESHGN